MISTLNSINIHMLVHPSHYHSENHHNSRPSYNLVLDAGMRHLRISIFHCTFYDAEALAYFQTPWK